MAKSLGSASLITSVDLSGLTSGLTRGMAMVQSFGARMNASSVGMSIGQRVTSGFRRGFAQMSAISGRFSLMNPTAVLGGLGIAGAIRGFATFESSMSQVRTLSQASEEDFQRLWAQAEMLGATTRFTAGQAAEGMRELALQGRPVEDILASMPGLLNFAAAGGTDMAESVRIAGTALNVFRLPAEQMGMVADVMTQGFTNSAMGMEDLGQAFLYGAAGAANAGVSINEFTAMMMTFAQGGDIGTRAGRQFRMGIGRLQDATGPASQVLRQLGVSIADAGGNFRPIADIIDDLGVSLSGYTQVQRNAMIADIFGMESMNAWSTAIRLGGDEIRRNTALTQVSGRASEVAEARMDNLAGSWIRFTSALSGATNLLSKIASPALRGLLSVLTSAASAFAQMSPETQRWITGLMAAGSAMLAVNVLIPRLVMGIRMIGAALGFSLTNPIGIAVAAIGLIAGAIAMMDPADRLQLFEEAWAAISTAVDEVWAAIRPLVEMFGVILPENISISEVLLQAFSGVILVVATSVGMVVDSFVWMKGVVEEVVGFSLEQMGALYNGLQRFSNFSTNVSGGVWAILTGQESSGPANLFGDPNQTNGLLDMGGRLRNMGANDQGAAGNATMNIINAWAATRDQMNAEREAQFMADTLEEVLQAYQAKFDAEQIMAELNAEQWQALPGQMLEAFTRGVADSSFDEWEVMQEVFAAYEEEMNRPAGLDGMFAILGAFGQGASAVQQAFGIKTDKAGDWMTDKFATQQVERQVAEYRTTGAQLSGTGAAAETIARALYAPRVTEEQRIANSQLEELKEQNRQLRDMNERLRRGNPPEEVI